MSLRIEAVGRELNYVNRCINVTYSMNKSLDEKLLSIGCYLLNSQARWVYYKKMIKGLLPLINV